MRHQNLELVTQDIARSLYGRAAEQVTQKAQDLTDPVGIYVLPLWAWGPSLINVGRKDLWSDGSRLDMPIRLDWDVPVVGRIADLPDGKATYTTYSAGYTETAAVDVTTSSLTIRPSLEDIPMGVDWAPTLEVLAAHVSPAVYSTLLADMSASGKEGYWSLMARIEDHARYEVPRAIASLSMSAFGPEWAHGRELIDQVDQALLISRFTLGDEETPRSPAVRLIERCLTPGAFAKADPQKMMATSVHRDIREELRKMTGDPREGAAIRETARSIGVAAGCTDDESVERVCEAHNALHPTRRVGQQRVRSALTVIHNTPGIVSDPQNYESSLATEMWGAVR